MAQISHTKRRNILTKFCLVSDLHIDFGVIHVDNTDDADCLIMAGDIVEVKSMRRASNVEFFKRINDQFSSVIWIPGNHEHYESDWNNTVEIANNHLIDIGCDNICMFDNQVDKIDGIDVICSTMWTNFNNANPMDMTTAWQRMNDYAYIGNGSDTLKPQDVLEQFNRSFEFIKESVRNSNKSIVVTHHSPIVYRASHHSNLWSAYSTDLSDFIYMNPTISHWCYGHLHDRSEHSVGVTRVISNCHGYTKYEPQLVQSFKPLYFEV